MSRSCTKGRVLAADEPARLRQLIPGRMLEVLAHGTAAADALRALPGVRDAQVFGERIHITLDDDSPSGARSGSGRHCARRRSPTRRCVRCSPLSKTCSSPGCRAARLRRARRRGRQGEPRCVIVDCRSCCCSPSAAGLVAAAQDVPVLRLTLDEAQSRAREASHRLAEARARESVAQATVDRARGRRPARRSPRSPATRARIT